MMADHRMNRQNFIPTEVIKNGCDSDNHLGNHHGSHHLPGNQVLQERKVRIVNQSERKVNADHY